MILTKQLIKAGISRHQNYNEEQIRALGSTKHRNPGWLKNLEGRYVTQEQYQAFLNLKDYHLRNKKPKQKDTPTLW